MLDGCIWSCWQRCGAHWDHRSFEDLTSDYNLQAVCCCYVLYSQDSQLFYYCFPSNLNASSSQAFNWRVSDAVRSFSQNLPPARITYPTAITRCAGVTSLSFDEVIRRY